METQPAEIVQAELYEVAPIVLGTQLTGITKEIPFVAVLIVLATRLIATMMAGLYVLGRIASVIPHTGTTKVIQFAAQRIVSVTRPIGTIMEIEYVVQQIVLGIQPVDKGEKMEKEDLQKLRNTEDQQIMEHLKAIIEIVRTKCDRCKNPFCQGCTFSPGDGLKGNLAEALKYMRIQNNDKFAEIFYPTKPKSFMEDEDLFENLIMKVRQ